MSGSAPVYRPAGPTVALSVVATSHAAVNLNVTANENANFVALINPGAVAVAVRLGQAGDAATLPVDGTPGDFILPPLMQQASFVPMPWNSQAPAKITAIGAAAGPTIIYATPVVMQS